MAKQKLQSSTSTHTDTIARIHIPTRKVHTPAEIDLLSPYSGDRRVSMFPYTLDLIRDFRRLRRHSLRDVQAANMLLVFNALYRDRRLSWRFNVSQRCSYTSSWSYLTAMVSYLWLAHCKV